MERGANAIGHCKMGCEGVRGQVPFRLLQSPAKEYAAMNQREREREGQRERGAAELTLLYCTAARGSGQDVRNAR